MPALLIAAAAAALAAPHYTAEAATQIQRAYPVDAVRNEWSAAAVIEGEVDPKGRMRNCRTLGIFGEKRLADRICGLVTPIKAEPASIDGMPGYGVYRTLIKLFLDDKLGQQIQDLHQSADLQFEVNKLPAGQTVMRAAINLLIDEAGHVQNCIGSGNEQADYAKVACEQVSDAAFPVVRGDDDQPVRYVRVLSIDFGLAPASDQTTATKSD